MVAANSQGVVTGHFTIPAGVPVGSKLVEFVGAGGSKGGATFVGRGQITTRELRQVNTEHTIITRRLEAFDPLAETFTLGEPSFVSAVDLWFTAKGSTGRTLIQLREAANGVPTRNVIVEVAVLTSSLQLNEFQRFAWAPVRLEAGVEYAVVIGCDDAVTSLAVAELGKFDSSANRWVTSQPYQVGVLLSSSNGSTWTPHQDRDLTFRLMATPLASASRTIALPSLTITGADELVVLAAVERPTASCDVTFTLNLPDGSTVTVSEGERILLASTLTGLVTWTANLRGTLTETPRLHKDIQLVSAARMTSGTYIARNIPITGSGGAKFALYYEGNTPSTSTITAEVSPNGTTGWVAIPVTNGVPLGGNWFDTTAVALGYAAANAHLRITLGGDARRRPQVRKLRAVVT